MISRAMNEDYITVEVLGSDYENQWDLLAGVYKFRVSTFLKSLVFESKEKRVTIDRSLIKDYGIRSINKRKYYFFCLGSRSPFGKGEIILNSFDFDLDEFNNYVRTHIKTTSKALSLHANKSLSLKRSVSRKNGRIKSRTSSESDVTKQVSNLSKLFSKLFKSKKDRKKKLLKDRDSLTSKEDYSVVDEYSEILPSGYSGQTYLCTSEDLSDSESMGLVLPSPDFKTKSCKSFKKNNPKNHLKWHEQNEIYSEYAPSYLIPVEHETKHEVLVKETGDVYTLPMTKKKPRTLPKKSKIRLSKGSNIVDYYNEDSSAHLYYNCDNDLIEEEMCDNES